MDGPKTVNETDDITQGSDRPFLTLKLTFASEPFSHESSR